MATQGISKTQDKELLIAHYQNPLLTKATDTFLYNIWPELKNHCYPHSINIAFQLSIKLLNTHNFAQAKQLIQELSNHLHTEAQLLLTVSNQANTETKKILS